MSGHYRRVLAACRLLGRCGGVGLLLVLPGGCGWHALYGGQPGVGALAEVRVSPIPERRGQRLRLDLQRALGSDAGQPPRFTLDVSYDEQRVGVGILTDSSLTRMRVVGVAHFALRTLDGTVTCAAGTERQTDGTDLLNQQFFAGDLQTEAASARLSAHVADRIAQRLGAAFNHPVSDACAS